jgi:Tol biopolymer transport system component
VARRLALGLIVACGCNAKISDAPVDGSNGRPDTSNAIDAPPDTAVLGAWGAPQPVPGAADPALNEDDETLSSTTTEFYFSIVIAGAKDLYVMTRASPTSPWGPKTALTQFNTTGQEESPRLSPDDLTLYFGRDGDIFMATRTAVGQPWGAATAVGQNVNTANYEKWLAVCSGGYFMVSRNGGGQGQDLYEGTLGGPAATVVTSLNSASNEISTFLSADCLTVYFASNRGATTDLYMATRPTATSAWGSAIVMTDFNTATFGEEDPWISTDQRTFSFASDAGGTKDLYISTR